MQSPSQHHQDQETEHGYRCDALTRHVVDDLTYSYQGVFEADDIRKSMDDA